MVISHPVRLPQILYETIWNTSAFNDQAMWPEDGSQPFVLSTGDESGTDILYLYRNEVRLMTLYYCVFHGE